MDYTELAKQFLHNSFQYRIRGRHKKLDETMGGEAFALAYIFRRGGEVLPSDISSEMNVSTARVAVILNNLEGKGYLTRRIDQKDRRRVLVRLTNKGFDYAKAHSEAVLSYTVKVLESLGEHDSKELVRIIGRMSELEL